MAGYNLNQHGPRVAHDHVKTSARYGAPVERDPVAHILTMASRDPTSRPVALAAKCVQCRGDAKAIRECSDRGCALWLIRPFQYNHAPHPAAHLHRPAPNEEPGLLDDTGDDE
jgi:hypothetical protein